MKAIRVHKFGEPDVLRLETVEDPEPGPGQVLIRMHAIGVNPVETYIRSGAYAQLPDLPFTPGTDGAGVVEAIGRGADRFRCGDRVYTGGTVTGSYAEHAIASTETVHPLPDNVDFPQGAALGVPYATAYRALFQRARAQPGETVLVHGGTGAVGLAVIQLAVAAGLRVIATGGSEAGRELALAQGAWQVLDHHRPGYMDEVQGLTNGNGVELIVEMLANRNLGRDLQVLADSGRVAVVGCRGPVEINPRELMRRDAAILGVVLWKTPAQDMVGIHAALYAGLANGTLKPVVARHWPLDQAAQAHLAIHETTARGKFVLVP